MPVEPNDENVTVEKLQRELIEMFGSDEKIMNEWLDSPIPALDGERPQNLFDTPARRHRLYLVLQSMKYGEPA